MLNDGVRFTDSLQIQGEIVLKQTSMLVSVVMMGKSLSHSQSQALGERKTVRGSPQRILSQAECHSTRKNNHRKVTSSYRELTDPQQKHRKAGSIGSPGQSKMSPR